jgi:hypothetical protein
MKPKIAGDIKSKYEEANVVTIVSYLPSDLWCDLAATQM